MIRRLDKRNYPSVRMVIDTEPEESNPFCSTCASVGKLSKLKNRIYLDDKGKLLVPQPIDADNYLQCWNCGLIIPTREAQMLGKISPINGVSPVENPADFSKGKILGIDSRLSNRIRKLKRRQSKHEDPEVQKLLENGWTIQSYKTSMRT